MDECLFSSSVCRVGLTLIFLFGAPWFTLHHGTMKLTNVHLCSQASEIHNLHPGDLCLYKVQNALGESYAETYLIVAWEISHSQEHSCHTL